MKRFRILALIGTGVFFVVVINIVMAAPTATIAVNPGVTYQTITGWEAVLQSGENACVSFDLYKNTLFDQAINDLGINRVRLEIRSGLENPVDYFTLLLNGEITQDEYRQHRFEIINDNGDANVVNPSGFQFADIDYKIEHVILPLKQRLESRGETLHINVTYVDFAPSAYEHKDHPEEYAEFVLAAYEHMENTYGLIPDSWEVILEPDTNADWSGAQVGNAIAAAGNRIQAEGYTPTFNAPSTTNMGNAVTWFAQILLVPGAVDFMSELTYHRYAGVSSQNLAAIANLAAQHGLDTAMLEHIDSGYEDLHQDLKLGMNSAWEQFALAFCTNDNGAQYYWINESNPNNPVVNLGARAKFLRQYFKFIREGAVRIGASTNDNAFDPLAFINTNGRYVVVVKASQGGAITVGGLPAGTYGIKYTTASAYNVDLSDVTIGTGGDINTSIPAAGVLTIYGKAGPQPSFENKINLPLLIKSSPTILGSSVVSDDVLGLSCGDHSTP